MTLSDHEALAAAGYARRAARGDLWARTVDGREVSIMRTGAWCWTLTVIARPGGAVLAESGHPSAAAAILAGLDELAAAGAAAVTP